MEITEEENPQSSEVPHDDNNRPSGNAVPGHEDNNNKDAERSFTKSDEEIREVLEAIATTGRFWHEWEELKSILSFRLKQVMAEYPESQDENDTSSRHESYPELMRRLDEALQSFTEGPPFTLQRLCEILLSPKSLYPKLSKLALALDKNLLVTSTLARSAEPHAAPEPEAAPEPANGRLDEASDATASNEDTEMVEAEADEDGASKDGEKQEEAPGLQGEAGSGENHA